MKIIKVIIFILFSLFFLPYFSAISYEEANYEVINVNKNYEIRKYSDRLAIETFEDTVNGNFRKLFSYISGKNETNEKIQMTTPVTQIKKNGIMSMQFYLPQKFNLVNAPNPINKEINIINVEGGYFAVITYSGRASENNFLIHKNILKKELENDNIKIISPPIRATYDSPFTLPMNRRNEAMFKVSFD